MLTVSQAAQELERTPVTIRKLCQSGKLPAIKLGTMWLISRTDLDEFKRLNRTHGWYRKAQGLDRASLAM